MADFETDLRIGGFIYVPVKLKKALKDAFLSLKSRIVKIQAQELLLNRGW